MKKISESEQEIMMAIWNAENKNSITASYLEEVFGEKNGKSNFYEPIVSYEEFSRRASKHILDKLYRNSLKNFVVSLYDGDELSRQDVKELREFLDEISTKSEEE